MHRDFGAEDHQEGALVETTCRKEKGFESQASKKQRLEPIAPTSQTCRRRQACSRLGRRLFKLCAHVKLLLFTVDELDLMICWHREEHHDL